MDRTIEPSGALAEFEAKIGTARDRLQNLKSDRAVRNVALFGASPDVDLLDQAWKIYAGALKTSITGGADWQNLQIVTVPSQVQWDDPDYGPYYFHKVTADLINQSGGTYAKTEKSFSERYGDFITDVQRSPIDLQALQDSRTALTRAQQEEATHIDLQNTIAAEWQAFDDRQRQAYPNQPSRWKNVEAWYHDTRSDETLSDSNQIVLGYYGQYYYLIQKAYGGAETLVGMLDKWSNFVPLHVKQPRLGTNQAAGFVDILPYQLSVDYPSWLADARAERHQKVRFTVHHESYQYDYSQTDIGGGIGIGFGFFGLIAGGNRQTVQVDTTDEAFTLNFEADMQVFEILPGPWYATSAFDLFRTGPFFPGSPTDNLAKTNRLWGPSGFLSFRPMRAIVAYKPVVTIALSRQDYHYFHQVTRGAAAFCIGPFVIGGASYYQEQTNVRWNDDAATITIYDGPDAAQLIAFDSVSL